MLNKLESQLAKTILCLGAIEVLAETYRDNENMRQDAFLFDTVYGALWDALIIRTVSLWDETKGVVSLPKLNGELEFLQKRTGKQKTSEQVKLGEWRHNVVAHNRLSLNAEEFDKNNNINVSEVRAELERIERLLAEAYKRLGKPSPIYDALKDDALYNARVSLARWSRVDD